MSIFKSKSKDALSYRHYVARDAPKRAESLSTTDCSGWVGERVVIPLQGHSTPQPGTIRYIGSDCDGNLCAGIEFDSYVGGISGKLNGQKLFKCRKKHGLLIPVEYVQFASEVRNGVFRPRNSNINENSNYERPGSSNPRSSESSRLASWQEFVSADLPTLKIGDNVVWLGDENPESGIVKWTGRTGRNNSLPLKAWVEMDKPVENVAMDGNVDIGTKFGCARRHGKFLPVDALILLEDFLPPTENGAKNFSNASNAGFPEYKAEDFNSNNNNVENWNCTGLIDAPYPEYSSHPPVVNNLIELVPGENSRNGNRQPHKVEENELLNEIFSKVMEIGPDNANSSPSPEPGNTGLIKIEPSKNSKTYSEDLLSIFASSSPSPTPEVVVIPATPNWSSTNPFLEFMKPQEQPLNNTTNQLPLSAYNFPTAAITATVTNTNGLSTAAATNNANGFSAPAAANNANGFSAPAAANNANGFSTAAAANNTNGFSSAAATAAATNGFSTAANFKNGAIIEEEHIYDTPYEPLYPKNPSPPIPHSVPTAISQSGGNTNPLAALQSRHENIESQMGQSQFLPPFIIPPIDFKEFDLTVGTKGIQGNKNSCYMDVVLFSMFGFTDKFEKIFLKVDKNEDLETKITRKLLFEEIVNPLRQDFYCSAEKVQKLRERLFRFNSMLDGGFVDVEEFMHILFKKAFQMPEFIKYDSDVKDFIHHIQFDRDGEFSMVTTIEKSFVQSMQVYGLKLEATPNPALILCIPKNISNPSSQPIVVPNLVLDLGLLLVNEHNMQRRMSLAAVLCIRDFHYVAFIKGGQEIMSPWIFYDPGANQEIAKVESIPNFGALLESLEFQAKMSPHKLQSEFSTLHPLAQRLLKDMLSASR